jgi:hypothetical protein
MGNRSAKPPWFSSPSDHINFCGLTIPPFAYIRILKS